MPILFKKSRRKEKNERQIREGGGGEDFVSVLSDRGFKDLPNKMTPQPEHERKRGE